MINVGNMLPLYIVGVFIIFVALFLIIFGNKSIAKGLIDYHYDKLHKVMTLEYKKGKKVTYYGFARLWRYTDDYKRCTPDKEKELYKLWQSIYYGDKAKLRTKI